MDSSDLLWEGMAARDSPSIADNLRQDQTHLELHDLDQEWGRRLSLQMPLFDSGQTRLIVGLYTDSGTVNESLEWGSTLT